jgi:hypothetical protein
MHAFAQDQTQGDAQLPANTQATARANLAGSLQFLLLRHAILLWDHEIGEVFGWTHNINTMVSTAWFNGIGIVL